MNDRHFMGLALEQAQQALHDGEFPVGCVVVANQQVVASGARQGTRAGRPNEIDHAEMAALRRLADQAPDIGHQGLVAYCTMEPCLMCFAALMLHRIARVVYAYEDVMGGGTQCNLETLPPLYRTLKPEVVGGLMRSESLALFQAFFADPANDYWRESLLATYTCGQ